MLEIITELTPEQKLLLTQVKEKWTVNFSLNSEPIDQQKVEQAIYRIYQYLGVDNSPKISWFYNPLDAIEYLLFEYYNLPQIFEEVYEILEQRDDRFKIYDVYHDTLWKFIEKKQTKNHLFYSVNYEEFDNHLEYEYKTKSWLAVVQQQIHEKFNINETNLDLISNYNPEYTRFDFIYEYMDYFIDNEVLYYLTKNFNTNTLDIEIDESMKDFVFWIMMGELYGCQRFYRKPISDSLQTISQQNISKILEKRKQIINRLRSFCKILGSKYPQGMITTSVDWYNLGYYYEDIWYNSISSNLHGLYYPDILDVPSIVTLIYNDFFNTLGIGSLPFLNTLSVPLKYCGLWWAFKDETIIVSKPSILEMEFDKKGNIKNLVYEGFTF